MLRDLGRWWMGQMRDMVPASARSRLSLRAELVAELDDDSFVRLFLEGRRNRGDIGKFALDDPDLSSCLRLLPDVSRRTLVLRIPPRLMLDHVITLPLGAERDLRSVLTFEMDRLTPFSAGQIYWTESIERRDTRRALLHVRLSLVPRHLLDPVLEALRKAGIAPNRVEANGSADTMRVVQLSGNSPRRAWWEARAEACMMATCCLLAVVAVVLPFVLQGIALSEVDARIEASRGEVQEVERLRKQIALNRMSTDAASEGRNQLGVALKSLAVLTDVLPDDTALTKLSMHRREITFSGRSSSSARLIGAMTANPNIRGPSFVAAVIRDEASSTEAFSIRAEFLP